MPSVRGQGIGKSSCVDRTGLPADSLKLRDKHTHRCRTAWSSARASQALVKQLSKTIKLLDRQQEYRLAFHRASFHDDLAKVVACNPFASTCGRLRRMGGHCNLVGPSSDVIEAGNVIAETAWLAGQTELVHHCEIRLLQVRDPCAG